MTKCLITLVAAITFIAESAHASDNPGAPPPLAAASSPAIQALRQQLEQQRAAYFAQKANLLQGLKSADARGREELRLRLKAARDTFLDQQRQTRDELQLMIQAQRERLPEHKDLIDQAKSSLRPRKDGGG